MIVVDASALARLVAGLGQDASWVAAQVRGEPELHAPELVDPETLSVLRRLVLSKALGLEDAARAVDSLLDAPVIRYPHRPFVERSWELRGQLTAYDAMYVALAEALGAALLTTDRRLARAVRTVEVVVPT